MMTVPRQGESDVPLGVIGRLAGLRVIPPELHAGEEIRWSARANRLQHKLRAVGGRLYLTDHRLIFGRSKLESLLGGKEWNALLGELISVAIAGGRIGMVRIELTNGKIERFLLTNKDQSATIINAAIRDAASASQKN